VAIIIIFISLKLLVLLAFMPACNAAAKIFLKNIWRYQKNYFIFVLQK